jgi:hypothetical protein
MPTVLFPNPRFKGRQEVPTFEEVAQQVHIDRMPTCKNAKHGQPWIDSLRDCAFPKIERMPDDSVGQPGVIMCLALIWTEKHKTAKGLAQNQHRSGRDTLKRFGPAKTPLCRSRSGVGQGEGEAQAPQSHSLEGRKAMLAKALMLHSEAPSLMKMLRE